MNIHSDGHVHTFLCGHAKGTMEDYVRAAIQKKLKELVFLEHLEWGADYFEKTWLGEGDFLQYFKEGKRLQEKYDQLLAIRLGVEVGYNPQHVNELQTFLKKYQWDRIGLSYHFLITEPPYLNFVSRKKENIEKADRIGLEKVVDAYYHGILDAIETIDADVLCHLDAVMRFHPAIGEINARVLQEKVLETISSRGMALEVNTSGFSIRGEPFPGRHLIQKAIALGIPLLVGSDAHRPQDVGRYFDRLAALR